MDAGPIKIIDVIHHYASHCGKPLLQVFVVVNRMPEFVYTRAGDDLMAHDSGFYDFMYVERARGMQAFAGREFEIKLDDGSTLLCNGQVWSGCRVEAPETLVQVGVSTIEKLAEYHVFSGGVVSKAKYEAWLAMNKPSHNYEKYDSRSSLGYWDRLYRDNPALDRTVSAKRARKLRQRGITIRRDSATGKPGWSRTYERKKSEIADKNSPDYKGRFHPENFPG